METNNDRVEDKGKYSKQQLEDARFGWFLYDAPYKCARYIGQMVSGKSVFDMGAGTGIMAKIVAAITNKQVYPYEGNLYFTDYPDEQFGTVYSSHVLEHLAEPEKMIKESIRIASKKVIHIVPQGNVDHLNLGTPHLRYFNRKTLYNMVFEITKGRYPTTITFIEDCHMNSLMITIHKG